MIPSLISIAKLKSDFERMRFSGFWPAKVECGPLVYELLVNWTIYGQKFPALDDIGEARRAAREDRIRGELMAGDACLTFNDMPVQMFDDVPDGQFWPSREKGTNAVKPFAGTEAHDVVSAT
jgi:hypothetical protein